MKKLYFLLFALLLSAGVQAQCFATMDVVAEGNSVTATIIGEGATVPGYGITWGDGSEDALSSATHVYDAPGTYQICYVYYDMSNIINCNQTACQDVIITGTGCTMDFTPYALGLNVSVAVDGFGAGAPQYTIDWGDGSSVSTDQTAGHTYAADGTYTICATYADADNPDNCTLIMCHDITVQAQTGSCVVDLFVTVDGASVSVTSAGTGAVNENYIITWGDNSFDNAASGIHTYSALGSYEICVTYGDFGPSGCSVTECQTVEITEAATTCTLTINPIAVGLTVGLTANGAGAVQPEYTVDWGDSSPNENTLPTTHNYSAAGTYLICVSYVDLSNLENCQINVCQEVTVSESTTDCTVELVLTQTGNVITATATGTGAVSPQYGINWDEGGLPTIGNTGTHTYATSGDYEICVTYLDVTNIAGCNATDCQIVTITVGVEESVFGPSAISVNPNPIADNSNLNLNLTKPSFVTVNVYDMVGNLVANIYNGQKGNGSQQIQWNTTALSSGIYLVKVKAGDEERTIKVIR